MQRNRKQNQTFGSRRKRCCAELRRRGAALVEFAVIAPAFITLIVGTLEMGHALDTSTTLMSGLREGGRLATMSWKGNLPADTTLNDKVITDIRNFYNAAGLPGEKVTIKITSFSANSNEDGLPFDVMDENNSQKMFRISAEVDFAEVYGSSLTFMKGRTMRTELIFRAGHYK